MSCENSFYFPFKFNYQYSFITEIPMKNPCYNNTPCDFNRNFIKSND